MLAVLADAPTHERWLQRTDLVFEPKYDGIRALIEVIPPLPPLPRSGGERSIRIWSRLGNDKTSQFPEIVEALSGFARTLDRPLMADGEIVAVGANGRPLGFQYLQGRLHVRGVRLSAMPAPASVAFIAFDLLREGDDDLRSLPFSERRRRLERYFTVTGAGRVRLTESSRGNGLALRKRAEREGWEGVMVKDPAAKYLSGRRHPAWHKLKFVHTEEFIVGGWTPPRGSRQFLGALLVGCFRDEEAEGSLHEPRTADHAAGGDAKRLPRPSQRAASIIQSSRGPTPARAAPRLADSSSRAFGAPPPNADARRLRASHQLRAAVAAAAGAPQPLIYAGSVGSGFTDAELKRLFMQLRTLASDTSPFADPSVVPTGARWVRPEIVVQVKFTERTMDGLLRNPVYLGPRDDKRAEEITANPKRRTANREPRTTNREPDSAVRHLLSQLEDLESRRRRGTLVLPDGVAVEVGNLEKVFWPAAGITKGELLRYYLRVAPYLLPAVADRPLVMKRFPNGVEGQSFYQHRAPQPVPEGLRVAVVREKPDDAASGVSYLIGGSLGTLLYMTQLAVISQDPWFSRLPDLEAADVAAFDLDPMPGASFAQVLEVARWIHDELEALGAPSVPKTSGASGLHIYVPLPRGTPYEAGMIFCQIVATVVAARHPRAATVDRMVQGRKPGTVYIDYLQNIYGKTLATAYSARASEFAGVSTPLSWPEVHEGSTRGLDPSAFTIRSIFPRLASVGDLWARLRRAKPVRLEAAFKYASSSRSTPGRSRG